MTNSIHRPPRNSENLSFASRFIALLTSWNHCHTDLMLTICFGFFHRGRRLCLSTFRRGTPELRPLHSQEAASQGQFRCWQFLNTRINPIPDEGKSFSSMRALTEWEELYIKWWLQKPDIDCGTSTMGRMA